MPITHTNREGDVYYLHVTRTKAGRTGHHFSRKRTGELADAIPEGYEIYEKPPSAQVFLRKIKPKAITDEEVTLVYRRVRELTKFSHPLIDVDGKSVVVYLPARDREELERLVEELSPFGRLGLERKVAELERRGPYTAMMRFTLVDEETRTFCTDRWCFKGSIDDWFPLMGGRGSLEELPAKYVPHLGRESFYELF
jgi:hypothetical protein